ncbi:MAG: EMC3/TMCO1 family protein [Candidatus Helarchaeota archaeon]
MESKYKWLIGIACVILFTIIFFIAANPYINPVMIPFWSSIQSFFRSNFLASFFSVILYAFLLALITNLLTRSIVDVKRMKRYTTEINKWKEQEKRAKALREKGLFDKKLEIKVKRKKKYIEKIQRSMATERMKPTVITFVPFIILFLILNYFVFPVLVANPVVVAIFPFNLAKIPYIGPMMGPVTQYQLKVNLYVINNGFYLYFMGWYTICMFGFNTFLQKILGTRFDTGSPFG